MRMYQEVGLHPEALEFLKTNVKQLPNLVCPKCGEVISYKMDCEVYDKHDMFHGDGPSLRKYNLQDGRVVKEIIQASPWSSGPVTFFCLEFEDGSKMFEWTEDEMRPHL
jgi:hypothetical protein